jgi:hypothetical protein
VVQLSLDWPSTIGHPPALILCNGQWQKSR